MPEVTVPDRPSGEPTATTVWPTTRLAELPSVAGVQPETPFALMTARSELGSRPMISASTVLPSWVVTCREPPAAAPATTWLLVRISPSELRMMPEPSPPLPSVDRSTIDTTLGSTLAATASTDPLGRTTLAWLLDASVDRLELVEPLSWLEATRAPTPPPTPLATRAVARTRARVRPPRDFAGASATAVPAPAATGAPNSESIGTDVGSSTVGCVPYGYVP